MFGLDYWSVRARIAAKVIRLGGVVAHPTEAVWGLACDPANANAVERILQLKSRPVEKGLILVSAQASDFAPLLSNLSDAQRKQFLTDQGQPTTWLLPDPEDIIPSYIKGKFKSVAVRVSSHSLVCCLSRYVGGPIVSTSANPAGMNPAKSISAARRYFGSGVDMYVNGPLGGYDRPSQIIDIQSNDCLRS